MAKGQRGEQGERGPRGFTDAGQAFGELKASVEAMAGTFRDYREDTRVWRAEMKQEITGLRAEALNRMDKHEASDGDHFNGIYARLTKLDRARWHAIGYVTGGAAATTLVGGLAWAAARVIFKIG